MAAKAPTIVFFPEGAFGPTNNCVGIGDVLRRRGARVVFIVEESFAGNLEAKGFEERLMRLGPPPDEPEIPGQFWKDFIRDTAPLFRQPTIEQLGSFLQPTWQALIDGSKYVNGRLAEIFDELQPDVIVEDNVVAFPAIAASGGPWARIVSCNPLELTRPRPAARLLRLPDGRSRLGGASSEAEHLPHARRHVARLRRLRAGARRTGPGRARVHARVAVSQPLRLSRRRPTIARRRPLGADLAPAGVLGSRDGRRVGGAGELRRPRRQARLPEPRQPRRPPTSS